MEDLTRTRFRKDLLEDGFTMMQFSVDFRHCASFDNAELHAARMGAKVPEKGEVRFLTITDEQFGRIKVYVGKKAGQSRPSTCTASAFLTAESKKPPRFQTIMRGRF